LYHVTHGSRACDFFRASESLAARRASARAIRDARVSPAKLELRRIGVFRAVSLASPNGLASSRAASSTRTRFNTRANRVVTRERDRSPAGAMRASSRSPARLAEARARGARLLAIALCASLPFAALAQTIDAHELNLCGSGTPPSVFLARLGAVPIPGLRTIVFFRLPCL
jgi:hypothetical protein